jgi:hypothetical protein
MSLIRFIRWSFLVVLPRAAGSSATNLPREALGERPDPTDRRLKEAICCRRFRVRAMIIADGTFARRPKTASKTCRATMLAAAPRRRL